MFGDALRVIVEIILEIEPAIGGQFSKDSYFTLTRFQGGADIIRRKPRKIDPGPLESPAAKLLKTLVTQLPHIFTIEPGAFLQIESSVLTMDLFQLKQVYDFLDVDFLPVIFRRPT